MNTSAHLDKALQQLEELGDTFEARLVAFEEAEENYEKEYLKAFATSQGSVEARKAEAKQFCIDTGTSAALRAKRAQLEAHKGRTRITIAVLDGLRSKLSSERVGI